jgi:hypothetical protein
MIRALQRSAELRRNSICGRPMALHGIPVGLDRSGGAAALSHVAERR